jgi:hypothetical protein
MVKWLCAAAHAAACLTATAQDVGPRGVFSPRGTQDAALAEAIIRAMEANDQSLRSMHWRQRGERWVDGAWAPSDEGERYFAPGRWGYHETRLVTDQDGVPGSREVAADFGSNTACIVAMHTGILVRRAIEPSDYKTRGPEAFLGRRIDVWGRFRLADLLRNAQELHILRQDGLSTLSGYCEVNGLSWNIEVELDERHGFAPKVITVYDGLLMWPVQQLVVTGWRQEQGAWIPSSGTDTLWYVPTDRDETWHRFEEAVSSNPKVDGRIVPGDPATRRAYRDAIHECFGDKGLPVEFLVAPKRFQVTEIMSINSDAAPTLVPANASGKWVDFLELSSWDDRPVGLSP